MGLKSKKSFSTKTLSLKSYGKFLIGGLITLLFLRHIALSSGISSKKTPIHFDEVYSTDISWDKLMLALKNEVSYFENNKIQIESRNIVIMHVGGFTMDNSLDVFVNNMKLFCSAIAQHSRNSDSKHHAFYLFNVIGGESNPLHSHIPVELPNVAVVDWNAANSVMDTHIRTIKRAGSALLKKFSAVIFMNQGVRGPLTHRANGQWLVEYRRLLDANNVGLVGSTISCEGEPHVQTHIFGMKTSSLFSILARSDERGHSVFSGSEAKSWEDMVHQTEVALSAGVADSGLNLSALMYDRRTGSAYFNGKCLPAPVGQENPTLWCDLMPQEIIFAKWDGEPLRTPGLLCEAAVDRMRLGLERMTGAEPGLGLIIPETLYGGNLYDLYRQFEHERRMFRESSQRAVTASSTSREVVADSKVCFLVRSASMHDSERLSSSAANSTSPITYGVKELVESLIAQQDPNWLAFVFKTDPSPFGERLQQILSRYEDDRLLYVAVAEAFLPPFTKADAGYTTTDHVLRTVLHDYPQCRWVSATNGDNAYGSGVVGAILASPAVDPVDARPLKMLLAPIDSRNFAELDYDYRGEKHHWFKRNTIRNKPPKHSLRSQLLPASAVPNEWNVRCESVRANMEFNLMAYVIQPRPRAGKVDLAAVFFRRSALLQENMYFGNFTNPSKYPCLGCQDGYLTEYLVRNRLWSYLRLPIDGLRSVIFHGPSPTLCIASGNVWFDHPHVDKVGCFTREAVIRLHKADERGKRARYDWNDFYRSNPQICLRLSKTAFLVEPVTVGNY